METKENNKICMKKGRFTSKITGMQPGVINWRCDDRKNCDICGYIYVVKDGRLSAVEEALIAGASVYICNKSDWNAIRRWESKRGLNKNYIKITIGTTNYIVAFNLSHKLVQKLDTKPNFYELLRYSDGRTQFSGEFALPKEEKEKSVKDFEFSSYLPIFADRQTEKIIAPTKIPKSLLSRIYINPLYEEVNSSNVELLMEWRAEALASVISLDKPEWKLVGFYEEEHQVNKEELDSGDLVTNRHVNSKLRGPAIADQTERMIDAIQFGEMDPLFKIDNYSVVRGKWEYIDGEVVLEVDAAQIKAYKEAEFKWFCDYIEGRADSTTYPKIEDFIIL